MKKLIGLSIFLTLLYGALLMADPSARSAENHINLAKRIGLFGVLCLGVTPLIISGGIDLSIGSVVGFCATLLAMLLKDYHWNPHRAVLLILVVGFTIGLINGTLVAKLRLQPFVVTLCGLFIFRSLARWIASDETKGVGGTDFSWYVEVFKNGDLLGIPKFFVIFLVLALIVGIILQGSVYGRYLFAIGANEKTARYSGINTERYKLSAYVVCSLFTAFFSVLYLTEYSSAAPSDAGNFFELYAIAGAVLGGVSLRGGEGHIVGVILGATILWILPNLTRMWGIDDKLQDTVIGAALLIGAVVDEILRGRVSGAQIGRVYAGLLNRYARLWGKSS
jgi:ribose transport system permease protein